MASILGSELRLQGGMFVLLHLEAALLMEPLVGVRRKVAVFSRSYLTGRGAVGSSSPCALGCRKQLKGMLRLGSYFWCTDVLGVAKSILSCGGCSSP